MGAVLVDHFADRAISGDRGAFETLLAPWLDSAFRLAYVMLRDREEAEDVVQEACLNAWTHIGRLEKPEAARAWFLAIVANRSRSHARRPWRRVLRFAQLSGADAAIDEGALADVADLRRALRGLSREHRAILMLRFGLDLPLTETAIALGLSNDGAKSRLRRALSALRAHLGDEEVLIDE